MPEKVVMREMTTLERQRVEAFGKCSFPVASFVKRFAADLVRQLRGSGNISERQARRLVIEVYRYRRQMPSDLVPVNAPDGYETSAQRMANAEAAAKLARYREQLAEARPCEDVTQPELFQT